MNGILPNLAVVLLFILIGGFFAAAELALVSLRESQALRLAADHPTKGARLLRLTQNPNRFLAAVQVGVTLAGFLSAGFGASQIAPAVAPWFEGLGLPANWSQTVAFILVTIVIAYLSLVLGELVPKRLALQRSEGIALRTAGIVDLLARVSRPFIWLLSVSTDGIMRLLGGDPDVGRERITEEELRGLVRTHEELTPAERELIDDVFAAGDRELREVMIPRTEVAFLAQDTVIRDAAAEVRTLPHSRYPVIGESTDDVVGFVHVRDILDASMSHGDNPLRKLVREVARLPGSLRVIPALTEMRDHSQHLAIVVDEYGGTDGIVTMEDLVEELVGDIRDEYDPGQAETAPGVDLASPRQISGLLNLDDFTDEFGMSLPEGPYETVAGFVMHALGRLPIVGDQVRTEQCDFTVVSLDGRRLDQLLITPVAPEPTNDGLRGSPGEVAS